MVDHISSDAAQVIGLFVEAVLYGVYFVSFGFVLFYIFWLETPKRRWRWPSGMRAVTLAVAVILALNSTLNLSLGLRRMMQNYVYKTHPKSPTWIDLAKPYSVTLQTLIADIFLTYRCWVVYCNAWMVTVFPIMLSVGSLAMYCWTLVIQTEITLHGKISLESKASQMLAPLFIAQFTLTTVLNIYTTAMIVYRIIKMDRATSRSSTHATSNQSRIYLSNKTQLKHVTRIIIDSAVVYTAASVMTFASYKSNVQYITSAVGIIMVGIVFNTIVIRLAMEKYRARTEESKGHLSTLKFESSPHPRISDSITDIRSLTTIHFSPSSDSGTVPEVGFSEKEFNV